MADFIPVSFTKDGVTEIADTQAEYIQYIWDGWTIGDLVPEIPRALISARLSDLDELEAELIALIGGGGVVLDLDDIPDTATRIAMTPAERTKLTGVASGATANSSDAILLSRANHLGTQTASTVSDFAEAVEDVVAALLARSTQTGITYSYDDASGTLSATVTGGGGGGIDEEVARDTVNAQFVGTAPIFITVNDAADTVTFSTTATVNSTDAFLLARANHTGTQSLDTTTDSATRLAMTAAERTKLTGVATGATANSSDATLLARANHTGTQSLDTTTDSATRLAMTAAERTKLTGVATGATANDTDANLKARANHTGTQLSSTISDFTSAVNALIAAAGGGGAGAIGDNVTITDNFDGTADITVVDGTEVTDAMVAGVIADTGSASYTALATVAVVKGQTFITTTVYVATTGSDSNNGLAVGTPFLTFQKVADYLASQGPILQGQWYVNAAAGTYTPEDVFFTTPSINSVIMRGPAVAGGVPTAIIDGGGNAAGALVTGQQYKHGLRPGNGANIELRDIKGINYHAGLTDKTRIPFVGDPGSRVYLNNCHATGASWTGGYGFATGRFYVNGGIYDGCRLGISVNSTQATIVGTTARNSTEAGIHWSRGSQGHLDDCFIEDNPLGLQVSENARVDTVGNDFKRNNVAIRTLSGGVFGEGGAPNILNAGTADANTTDYEFKAGSGDSVELATTTDYRCVATDRTTRTSTATTSEQTMSTPYTIKARRLYGTAKQCKVVVKGIYTVTAGGTVTVAIGGMTIAFTVPAAGTSVAFEIDVDLMEVTGGYRAIGKISQGLNLQRMASTATGFLSGSDQTITVKVTLANSADVVNIYRTAVYLMG